LISLTLFLRFFANATVPGHPGESRYCGEVQAEAVVLKGLDFMDTQTLIIIILLVLLLGGGGWYGRGRWF
jgi:hypothetical protein